MNFIAKPPALIYIGEPSLVASSAKIKKFNNDLIELYIAMVKIAQVHNGLGLAAPQVGYNVRLFIIDMHCDNPSGIFLSLINPIITSKDGEIITQEGCLSIPKVYAPIKRANEIRVKFYDLQGQKHQMQYQGIQSACIQHEIDHLDGKLFIDYLTKNQLIELGIN